MQRNAIELLQDAGIPCKAIESVQCASAALHRVILAGTDAIKAWNILRSRVNDTGLWPVLMRGAGEADPFVDMYKINGDESTPSEIVAHASSINVQEWLKSRREANEFCLADGDPEGAENHRAKTTSQTTWPDVVPPSEPTYISIADYRTRKPFSRVVLALVPTTKPWEVPAHLFFGNYNDCPEPSVHVAMLMYWNDGYGVEPVCMAHDIIETIVHRPPTTREAARHLALEQYIYCGDIVDQGVESVDALAQGLWRSPQWYFWWD